MKTKPVTSRSRVSGVAVPEVTGLPDAPRRRRPLLVAAGGLLALLVAAIALFVLQSVTATTLVWTTAAPVMRGTVVTEDQLAPVEVAEEAAGRLLAATIESRDLLVGQVWAADVPAGQYVSSALVADRVQVQAGTALVGLRLEPGGLPVTGLTAGDTVSVVHAPGGAGGQVSMLVESATVESVVVLSDQGSAAARLVTVSVPSDVAGEVAAAGMAGEVALVVVP